MEVIIIWNGEKRERKRFTDIEALKTFLNRNGDYIARFFLAEHE